MPAKQVKTDEGTIEILDGETCPICSQKTLTLTESERNIPHFGTMYLFSMSCKNKTCRYHKSDIEAAEQKDPVKWSLQVENEKDLNIRVIRSSTSTIKIPHMITVEPGPSSNGYITNVEGVLQRIKKRIELAKESEEDSSAKKKAKNMLKKLNKVLWGQEKLKLIIEDPSGNSTILSEKAQRSTLKK